MEPKAFEALRESEARYRGLIEAIPALVWVFDTSGRPVLHNRRWYDYTGKTPDDAADDRWHDILHPDDAAGAVAAWDRAKASGEPYEFEYRLRGADGAYRWFLSRKSTVRGPAGIEQWVGICADIDDRKRAVENLTTSEMSFRRLFEAAKDGILLVDPDTRKVLDANPFLADLIGGSREDLVGKELWEIGFFEDIAANKAAFETLQEKGYVRYDDRPLQARDGRRIEVEFVSNRYDVGDRWVIQCNVRDITKQKRAERHLAVQYAVVGILAEAPGLHEAASKLLRAVCESAGWEAGDLWLVDRTTNVLSFVDLWHAAGVEGGAFREASRRSTFARGAGLPGRVWAAGRSEWVADVTGDADFLRAAAAADAGLRGGFALPILFGSDVLGVVEFFSREGRRPDEELARTFESLGSQIGQFVERKRSEEGLRLFRALIDQATDGIEVIDPATGRFLDVNERACVVHGYTREEFLRMGVADVDPMVAGETWAGMAVAGRLAGARMLESRHRRKDGSTFPVEIRMDTIRLDRDYIVAVVRDVTDRHQAEEALRLRDRAIGAATQGIMITDCGRPDDPVIFASPGFERITGYAAAEILGRNCRFLQGKDTDPAAVARVREAVRAGQPCTVELLNYRKDGTTFWNEMSVSPVRDAAGRLTHFVGVQADVTARRGLEEQFRQVQKMEAVGQLAGGVAHDFNNLLTIINGYGDLLLQSLPPDDPSRALVDEIRKAGERSAGLTRQLLAFSRQQVLAPRVLDLNAVVADTESMLRRLIGEDVRLAAVLAPDLWPVRADPGQVEQVVMNLAVNARDAMPRGGRLTIETRNVDLDEAYARTHPDARAGPHALLSVSDTGTGMPPEVRARIFEPFFTTKGLGKGTGLGLATVYGIVKQSGGHVAAYSEVGVGTTFKVYLPRVEKAFGGPKAKSGLLSPPRGTETVLLVEDEAGVRALTRHVLSRCGYEVLEAADGEEAMRVAAAHRGPIHLLITDVVMPGAGGRAVAEQIAARHPAVRVLYVSGYTDDAVIRHGVLREGVSFLQKPFSPVGLALKVREVLDAAGVPGRA